MKRAALVAVGLAFACCCAAAEPRKVSLTVDEIVRAALAWSPELRAMDVRMRSAVESYRLGYRAFLPKLSVNFGQTNSIVVNAPDSRMDNIGVTATQLLFDAGRTSRKFQMSRLQLRLNDLARRDALDKARGQVRQLCVQIVVAKDKLRIQDDAIELSRAQLDVARAERSLGMSREIDVAETQAALDGLILDRVEAELALSQYRQSLTAALGFAEDVEVDPVGEIDSDYRGAEIVADLELFASRALAHSQELFSENFQIRGKYLELADARTWYLPDVSLETTYSVSGSHFPLQTPNLAARIVFSFPMKAMPVTVNSAAGQVGKNETDSSFSASVGILDDITGASQEASAKALLGIEAIKRDALRANLRQQVFQGVAHYRLQLRRLELQRRSIASQTAKNRIMAKQLELGEVKRIDYLSAESQLAQARMALVDQIAQLQEQEQALETLIGLPFREIGTVAREDTHETN